ncbi:MAG TPA: hypothetical protein VIJ94_09785 [Caulobacteraceae bacterium]
MPVQFNRLALLLALVGVGLPLAGQATASSSLTLFAEPGLKGRHATYRTASRGLERQGFFARSASSTGMWTLCEGGEVASRCQTVDGQAPELKLSPQIVRPGINALALYDQPGLKGRRVIYSFTADRPAPFHARSARTWGGPWSVCERDFRRCQTLEGPGQNLDLVVAAVRQGPGSADAPSAAPALAQPVKGPSPVRTLPTPRLAVVAAPRTPRPGARSTHGVRGDLFTQVRAPPRPRFSSPRHVQAFSSARYDRAVRHPAHAHLFRPVAERRPHRAHAARRRFDRRMRMPWGGPDPYLYDADPRDIGPPGPW